MELDEAPSHSPAHRRPSQPGAPRPKGILKNRSPSSTSTSGPSLANLVLDTPPERQGLVWDEANLSLNEVQKDSTMKITEPKTPYVRYNAETDEVMDLDKIPGFSLGTADLGASATSPTSSGGFGSRRGSEASEKMVRVERSDSFGNGSGASGGEEAMEDESDDEIADEETLVQRAHFKEKRGRHYSNEAEAMKRAQALIAAGDDEDEEEEERQRQIEEARVKGNTELNAANGGARRNGRVAPPVPAIPNGFRQ